MNAASTKGPHLRFDGNVAGLSAGGSPGQPGQTQRSTSGDRGSPMNYSVICSCGGFLGILGAFRANAEGARSTYCTVCQHATCISKTGQIISHVPYDLAANRPR